MQSQNILIQLFFLFIAIGSCTDAPAPNSSGGGGDGTDTFKTTETGRPAALTPADPPCSVEGEMQEGNWYISQGSLLLAVTGDSISSGTGHRVLSVYDATDCQLLERHVFPVNHSSDYGYRIAEIMYNNSSRLVGIKGFDVLYTFDLDQRRLTGPLEPQYKKERIATDAQSGMIQRLEVWENFLMGYAEDFGAFAFDLRDPANPVAVLPVAELKLSESDYSALFLLPSGERFQALIPRYDPVEKDFDINPLFEEPRPVQPATENGGPVSRFVILRLVPNPKKAVVIDLQERKIVPLPPNLEEATNSAILEWLQR